MKRIALLLFAGAMLAGVVAALAQTSTRTDARPAAQSAAEPASQSAKQVRGATPYIEIKNEPAPKLIVDPPLPEGLALGVVWIQYRVENLRIVPVFGEGAAKVSPRVGHLHITVDDLPCGGRTRATTIRSTSPVCRSASTRFALSWSTPTTKSFPDRPRR